MTISKPIPLYPTYVELKDVRLDDFPDLSRYFNIEDNWKLTNWVWGREFLSFTGRNKSEHTFTRFRTEVEKFLLWAFLVKDKSIDQYRKADILEYADFCWKPPASWICFANHERFREESGFQVQNPDWAPFRFVTAKGDTTCPDKRKYRPSQQTLQSTFTALSVFYNYLMDAEYCLGNPASLARKDCRYFINDSQVKEVKRLSEEQWLFLLNVAIKMADSDPRFERNLFLVASLKSLFLRISEYAERRDWSPVMGHFWEDKDKNWWLKVYGKGRKLRDITVPESFMGYLKRYRIYRGLPPLPLPQENRPILEKLRGQGGMSARQLSRLVQEVFDVAYERMKSERGENEARQLQQITTHWLRHTGASLEVERGRALKDISEDLGHSSMATTDTVYVQADDKKRAASGKGRDV